MKLIRAWKMVSTPILSLFMVSPLLAAPVTYTFTETNGTKFTDGNYITGTMTIDFDTKQMISVNLRIGNGNNTVAMFTSPSGYSTYTNVVCGTQREFYETWLYSGSYTLFLDFVPTNTTTPIPGETGVHTSYKIGSKSVNLQSNCVDFNESAPARPIPHGTSLSDSTKNTPNAPGQDAATVLDNNSDLQSLFSNLHTDKEKSDAVTETLPLFGGSTQDATLILLSGINKIVQSRISLQQGYGNSAEAFDAFATKEQKQNLGVGHRMWIKQFGLRTSQDAKNGLSGYNADGFGFIVGHDSRISPDFHLGGALALATNSIKSNSSITVQTADTFTYQLIGYGNYSPYELSNISFQADLGLNDTNGYRHMQFVGATAGSSYEGYNLHIGGGFSHLFQLNKEYAYLPLLRLDYTWIKDRAYTEEDAGILSLSVSPQTLHSLIVGLDNKIAYQYDQKLTFICTVGINYETLPRKSSVTATYAGAPHSPFKVERNLPDRLFMNGGIHVLYKAPGDVEVTGGYDAEFSKSHVNHAGSLKISWPF